MFNVFQVEPTHLIDEMIEAIVLTQVRLLQVPGHNKFCIFPDACKKHLHLVWGTVLHFICDDNSIVECSPTHVTEGFNRDGAFQLIVGQVFFKNIKCWFSPRFHLFVNVTWQVSHIFIRSNNWSRENNFTPKYTGNVFHANLTGSIVFPDPAGPVPTTIGFCDLSANMYLHCPAVLGNSILYI